MGARTWWAAAALVVLLVVGGLLLQQRGSHADGVAPVRDQSSRQSILVHGRGAPAPVTKAMREDAARFVADNGGNLHDVLAAGSAQPAWDRAVHDLGLGFVASGTGLTHGDGLDDWHWVLLTRRPTAAQLARLAQLPVDVRVFYGDSLSSGQATALGSRAGGLLQGRLAVKAWESGFASRYDALVVTYRPPADATAAELDSAEHTVLTDLADAQPDRLLPFPISFRRDPGLTVTGTAQ